MVKSYLESIHIHLLCPECKTTYYVEATAAFKEANNNLDVNFNCPNCNNKIRYSLLSFPHNQHITYHGVDGHKNPNIVGCVIDEHAAFGWDPKELKEQLKRIENIINEE